jgi:hypothetical protein
MIYKTLRRELEINQHDPIKRQGRMNTLNIVSIFIIGFDGRRHKGNNKITELRAILQRESQNS